MFLVAAQLTSFFNNFRIGSVFGDNFLINFASHCMNPKKDLTSLTVLGGFIFITASVLGDFGLIP